MGEQQFCHLVSQAVARRGVRISVGNTSRRSSHLNGMKGRLRSSARTPPVCGTSYARRPTRATADPRFAALILKCFNTAEARYSSLRISPSRAESSSFLLQRAAHGYHHHVPHKAQSLRSSSSDVENNVWWVLSVGCWRRGRAPVPEAGCESCSR